MKYTKKQVMQRVSSIRRAYKTGLLSVTEIQQYESLPQWVWAMQKTIAEWVRVAERLVDAHDNLPNCVWLQRNGYKGLQECMRKHREAFSHIKQKKVLKTVAQWVTVAAGLARKYKHIPNSGWLQTNGFVGLQRCILEHPKAFSHLTMLKLPSGGKKGMNLKIVNVNLAKQMRAQGKSLRNIATKLNVSVALVWRRLK